MMLERWTPKTELETLRRDLEHVFERTWPALFGPAEDTRHGWLPRVDVEETEEAYMLRADLPGMTAEEITVETEGPYVIFKGERRKEHEEAKDGVKRVERTFGTFYRRVELPEPVKTEAVEARYANGVLTVTVPKTLEARAKHVAVTAA